MPEVRNVSYKYKYLLNFPPLSMLHFVVRNVGSMQRPYSKKRIFYLTADQIFILQHSAFR